MKIRPLAVLFAAALLITGVSAALRASGPDENPETAKVVKKKMAAMMASRGQPTEAHAKLEPMIGTFDVEYSFSFGPGMPPITSKGRQTARWILGKRFIEVTSQSTPDEEFKMEAMAIIGFDTRSQKYFWFGVDSSDTYSVFAEGTLDDTGKVLTLLGTNDEPGLGKVPFKFINTRQDADHGTMEVWFQVKNAPGADKDGWFRVMSMTRTRVKDDAGK